MNEKFKNDSGVTLKSGVWYPNVMKLSMANRGRDIKASMWMTEKSGWLRF